MPWQAGVYTVTYLLAAVLFTAVVLALLPRDGGRTRTAFTLGFFYLLGMVYAAQLGFDLVLRPATRELGAVRFWRWVAEHPDALAQLDVVRLGWRLLELGQSGLWGGPLFVVASIGAVAWASPLPLAHKHGVLDAAAVALPLAMALSKVGCAVVGCCYGIEHDGWLGIAASWGLQERAPVPRIPVQLVDVVASAAIGLALWGAHRRGRARGGLLLRCVILLGAARCATELLRGDDGPTLVGLRATQWLAVTAVVGGAALLTVRGALDRLLAATTRAEIPAAGKGWAPLAGLGAGVVGVAFVVPAVVAPALFLPLLVAAILRRDREAALTHTAGLGVGTVAFAGLVSTSVGWSAAALAWTALAVLRAYRRSLSCDGRETPGLRTPP